MTSALASWLEELARFPMHEQIVRDQRAEKFRGERDALRAFKKSIPPMYRGARIDHPMCLHVGTISKAPPTAPSVVFIGPAGGGKTSLAVAYLQSLFEREVGSCPLLAEEEVDSLVRRFHFAHAHRLGAARLSKNAGAKEIRDAMRAEILLLDDLGNDAGIPSNPVPSIIAERHAEKRTTWITTGLDASEIGQRYGGGIARRIFQHATILGFRSP